MIENIMFAMSKEFGWTPDQILNLDFKHFNMYSRLLNEYYKATEAASKGKKYIPELNMNDSELERKRALLDKWSDTKKHDSNTNKSRGNT